MSHELPSSSNIPGCDHTTCRDPGRLEYCEIEANQPDGAASVNIEAIDKLFIKHDQPYGDVEYINDGRFRYLTYQSSYRQQEEMGHPLQTNVRIVHRYDVILRHDVYQVCIGWRVDRPDANNAFYETVYTLEQYPGAIYSTIDEYNLSTEVLKHGDGSHHRSRPMTPYDHTVLFDQIMILYGSRNTNTHADSSKASQ